MSFFFEMDESWKIDYSNTFVLSEITEMLPGILNQLGAESLTHLKRLAGNVGNLTGASGLAATGGLGAPPTVEEEDEDVPGKPF